MKKLLISLIVLCSVFAHADYQLYAQDKVQIGGALCLSGYALVSQNSSTTYNVPNNIAVVIFTNGQTQSIQGIILPENPDDGQMLCLDPVSAITTANVVTGKSADTLKTAITSFSAATPIRLIYSLINKTWYRW